MADALVSPTVAGVTAVISLGTLILAGNRIKKENNPSIIPMMGVMGAFVFAAQMINFTIPGTGSSGHIIGGVLLGAMMGPWAALITLASVIVVQCLIFADGGLMALGANILNMGICTALIAYPLVYKPLIRRGAASFLRMMTVSIAACVVGLELGAVLVTTETELSGVTALSWSNFFMLMTGIHLFIGIGEGIATGLVLYYVQQNSPQLLQSYSGGEREPSGRNTRRVYIVICSVALILAICFTWIASANPDGLEWSIERLTGSTELLPSGADGLHETFATAQQSVSILPDYESTWSGIAGCSIVVILLWALTSLFFKHKRQR